MIFSTKRSKSDNTKTSKKLAIICGIVSVVSISLVVALFCVINSLDPNSALAVNLQNLTGEQADSSSDSAPDSASTNSTGSGQAQDDDAPSSSTSSRACGKNRVLRQGRCVPKSTDKTTVTEVQTTDETTVTETVAEPVPTAADDSSDTSSLLLCQDRPGPMYIKQIHWYTAAEQQTNPNLAGQVGLAIWTFAEPIPMHFTDDVCRPALNEVGTDIRMGSGLTPTPLSVLQNSTQPADQDILNSTGRDLVIWYWNTTEYTIEYTDNVDQIWDY